MTPITQAGSEAGIDLDLAELEALERAATPGPWDIDTTRNDGEYGGGDDPGVGFDSYSIHDANGRVLLDTVNSDAASIEEDVGDEDMRAWDETARRNIEFIVALRNAFPALTAARRAPPAQTVADERARFQAHFMAEGWDERSFERYNIYDPDDKRSYISRHVGDMWDGWRAALAQPAAATGQAKQVLENFDELRTTGQAGATVAVPEGWKLVPVEPTDEMRAACHTLNYQDEIDAEWSAMLAAAPAAPASPPAGATVAAGEAFAWAAFADNGNVIIWSKRRSEVEPVAAKYGRPVTPVIALSVAAPASPTAAQVGAETEGMVLAPHFRGYAHLGIGAYVLNHSAAGEVPELAISIATEEQKAGRTVGDLRDNAPGEMVRPDDIAVRLRFENVAGLDALEQQLRFVRSVHFPDAAPVSPTAAQVGAEPVVTYPSIQHPDDAAVDRFAASMKAKMAASRAKGRSGWDNEALCPTDRLQSMLVEHLSKGDPTDIGNFAMMLWNRGERTAAPSSPAIGTASIDHIDARLSAAITQPSAADTGLDAKDAARLDCGHGHVHVRPDGMKARCGGPGMCMLCSRDRAAMSYPVSAAAVGAGGQNG